MNRMQKGSIKGKRTFANKTDTSMQHTDYFYNKIKLNMLDLSNIATLSECMMHCC